MDREEALLKKIAKLESINDQITAELAYLNQLTKALGFADGIETLKSAAIELLDTQKKDDQEKR